MLTFYAFGTMHPSGIGETKDLWVQWALEELGLPYQTHALDHTGGELDGEAYEKISPFRQAPLIDDDGFVVAESAAIVLYLAQKAGKLIPSDEQGRTHVTQWCFASVATLGATFTCLDFIGMFDAERKAPELHDATRQVAQRFLGEVERQLQGRDWIASDDFTVADLMLASVLRYIRKTDLMEPFPRLKDFYARCQARPAWQRTLVLYAERLGTTVDHIR